MKHRSRPVLFGLLSLLVASLLLGALVMPSGQALAASPNSDTAPPPTAGPPLPTASSEEDPAEPGEGEENADGDTAGEENEEGLGAVVTQLITHVITFPFPTLRDALVNTLAYMFEQAFKEGVGTKSSLGPLLRMGEELSKWFLQGEQLKAMRAEAWTGMLKVSLALLPISLLLTVVAAMKEGVTSVTGYANAREAALEWVVSVAVALGSLYLLELAVDLSRATSLFIADSMELSITGNILAGAWVKGIEFALFDGSPILKLFVGIFALLSVVAYIATVTLAFFAREVILIVFIAIAPLVSVLGAVRPLRWLSGMWAKVITVFLLLQPVNVLLLVIATRLQLAASDAQSGKVATLLYLMIMVGTISLLITVNGAMGKLVFGAAIEIAKKAASTTQQVIGIAAAVAGAPLLGSMAPSMGATSLLGSRLGSGGGGAVASGTLPGGAPGVPAETTSATQGTGQGAAGPVVGSGVRATASSSGDGLDAAVMAHRHQSGQASFARELGQTLAMSSRNPGMRAAGAALQAMGIGRQVAANRELNRAAAPPPSPPAQDLPKIDFERGFPGFEDAMSELQGVEAPGGLVAGSITRDEYRNRVSAGAEIARAAPVAAQDNGISGTSFFHALGYYRPGQNSVGDAGAAYIRAEAGGFALGSQSMWGRPQMSFTKTSGIIAQDYAMGGAIAQRFAGRSAAPVQAMQYFSRPETASALAQAASILRQSPDIHSFSDILDHAARNDTADQWVNEVNTWNPHRAVGLPGNAPDSDG
jgi:hypothetical protein